MKRPLRRANNENVWIYRAVSLGYLFVYHYTPSLDSRERRGDLWMLSTRAQRLRKEVTLTEANEKVARVIMCIEEED